MDVPAAGECPAGTDLREVARTRSRRIVGRTNWRVSGPERIDASPAPVVSGCSVLGSDDGVPLRSRSGRCESFRRRPAKRVCIGALQLESERYSRQVPEPQRSKFSRTFTSVEYPDFFFRLAGRASRTGHPQAALATSVGATGRIDYSAFNREGFPANATGPKAPGGQPDPFTRAAENAARAPPSFSRYPRLAAATLSEGWRCRTAASRIAEMLPETSALFGSMHGSSFEYPAARMDRSHKDEPPAPVEGRRRRFDSKRRKKARQVLEPVPGPVLESPCQPVGRESCRIGKTDDVTLVVVGKESCGCLGPGREKGFLVN